MIAAMLALLVCQLAGETIARGLALPAPGPVIGLAILFLALVALGRSSPAGGGGGRRPTEGDDPRPPPDISEDRPRPSALRADTLPSGEGSTNDPDGVPLPLAAVTGFLLAHLSLLFVPAGAGIVRHAPLLREHALPLGAALVGSTLLTLAVTAAVFVAVQRRRGAEDAA